MQKVLLLVGCAIALIAVSQAQVLGGVRHLSGDDLKEAENTLKTSLIKLAAGDGPHFGISKITSATRQTVSGTLYKYEAELTDANKDVKKCHVEIWSQPWLDNGIEVTFECDGQEKLLKKHSA